MSSATKKPRCSRSRAAKPGSDPYVVSDRDDRWVARSGSKEYASGNCVTKAQAVRAAEATLQVQGGEFRVRCGDGRLRKGYVIGRGPFARISAVEGIAPSREAKSRASEFDRKGLSPEERRRAIIEAYRTKG